MRILHMNPATVNEIGRLGENEYTRAVFDVADWIADYPDATFTLLNLRNGDDTAYPVPGVAQDGDAVLWDVTDADLTSEGLGKCELILLDNGVIAKSVIYLTRVLPTLDGSGEVPDPWETWQEEFAGIRDETIRASRDAESAMRDAEDAAGTATAARDEAVSARNEAVPASEAAQSAQRSAESARDTAIDAADRAEQGAANAGFVTFEIDASGHLIYTRMDIVDIDFEIENGHLFVEVAT